MEKLGVNGQKRKNRAAHPAGFLFHFVHFFTFFTFSRSQAGEIRMSMWAYLPVGPLERQLREGNQGVF